MSCKFMYLFVKFKNIYYTLNIGVDMGKVALVVDNSACLTEEEIKKYNIAKIIPISFVVNGEEYYENVNMNYTDFYNFLLDKNTEVSTSQPSAEDVAEGWREVLKSYDEIVYILLSSGLSGACNTAQNLSHDPEFEGKVQVVNNQRVAYMNKQSIIEASELIRQGKTAEQVKEYLEEVKFDCGVYIAVDTLKFLKKGGRITPAAAAIGTILNIKPILQIHGGKLDAYSKPFSMKQAKARLIQATRKEVEEKYSEELKNGQVYLGMAHTYKDLDAEELKKFEEEVKQAFPEMKVFRFDPLPLFIACHTGPNSLAVGYCVDRLGVLEHDHK